MVSLTPAPPSDLDSCTLIGRSPRVTGCLCSHLPWTLGLGQEGGVGSRCCCCHGSPALPPTPSSQAPEPQKGNSGLCHTGLAWA